MRYHYSSISHCIRTTFSASTQFVTDRPPTVWISSFSLLSLSNLLFDTLAALDVALSLLLPELPPFEKPLASPGPRSVLLDAGGSADREAELFAGELSSASPCVRFDCSGFVFDE